MKQMMEQMSLFDMDESKFKIYEVLEMNNLFYTIKAYYCYKNYENIVKYYYVRTTNDTIIDLCVSYDSQVFAVYEDFSDTIIKRIYKGNL
ncbi:hypothetical protein CN594_07865 [Bacillus toyonensis]|nr:hypothetical protein CN594_07865 [Bacillus toyonensis]